MDGYSPTSDLCIRNNGFQNWIKCVCAQNETRKALCEVVEVKWKSYTLQMTDEEKDHIEKFVDCLKNSKIDNFITSQAVLECEHSLCASILQKLLHLRNTELRSKENEIDGIPTSDSCYKHYWDIAKLYCVEDDSVTKAGLRRLDISTLTRMMNSCKLFAFDRSEEIYTTISEDRDELFHSSENAISDEKRSIVLEHASNLLSKLCGSRLKVCEDAIGDIQQMETKDWLSEYQYEYKQIARQNLEHKIEAIKFDMSSRDDKTLQDLLNSSEALIQMINESISADELQEEREVQKQKEEIKSERKALMEENRKLKERNSQLQIEKCRGWLHCNSCGWIIKGTRRTFYSSGLTNYHEEYFKKVAEKYGPIHLALLPFIYIWNISCFAEFKVTLSEVLNMHVDVGSQHSLVISPYWHGYGYHRNLEHELEQKMKNLQLDPSTLTFVRPGNIYQSI